MTGDPVRRIVIVGGGTAGWLSAVFLTAALGRAPDGGPTITLIESSDIGTVGVGEATVPTLRNTLRFCGIDEQEWMRACHASFKLAIRFVDWAPSAFWHPFGPQPSVEGFPIAEHWLRRRLGGDTTPFADACFPAVALCRANRSPRPLEHAEAGGTGDGGTEDGAVEYAYHLDAGLLATFLADVGRRRGVRHVVDRVTQVVRGSDGRIGHVATLAHGPIGGDLFLDCSGFAGLLSTRALAEPFRSFSDVLLCDSAIAIPVPTDDTDGTLEPFTTSTALSAGWAWRTPLFGRSGNGYVYSSEFLSPDEAEAELRRHLGRGADGSPARRLRMRVGCAERTWVHNCVSIGLAGGFIEPLESTGIWFVELALHTLLRHFPSTDPEPTVVEHFNEIMTRNYEQVRDFVVLHYCLTRRRDTAFWRAVSRAPRPPSLQRSLDRWRTTLPTWDRMDDPGFFKDLSVVSILDGMGHLPDRRPPRLDHHRDPDADARFRAIRDRGRRARRELPDHHRYLRELRGATRGSGP